MIILPDKQKSLELELPDGIVTNPIQWTASWVSVTDTCCGQIDYTHCEVDLENQGDATNSATTIIPAPPPAATNQTIAYQVEYISVYNCDTAPVLMSIQINNSGIPVPLLKITLQVGYTLIYNEDSGWQVCNASGFPTTVIISASGMIIGDPVIGGNPQSVLYTDAGGNLANSLCFFNSDSGNSVTIDNPVGGTMDIAANTVTATIGNTSLALEIIAGSINEHAPDVDITTDGIGLESGVQLTSTTAALYNNVGDFELLPLYALIEHNIKILFDCPVYNFAQLTASTFAYIDASNNFVSLANGTGVLTNNGSGTFTWGSAPAATTVAITDDTTTNATMYPTWVTANTGSLPLKVSSTKIFFNPSTGLLTTVGLTATGHVTLEGVTSTGAAGTGKFVFDNSPTLITPTLGVATATSLNKVAITPPTTSATLTLADGSTFVTVGAFTATATLTANSQVSIFARETMGDADKTFSSGKTVMQLTVALTAARVLTLPAANAFPAGTIIEFDDVIQGISLTNTVTVTPAGSDTVNGTSLILVYSTGARVVLVTDGISAWTGGVVTNQSDGTWQNWTPSYTGFSVNPSSVTARYCIIGKAFHFYINTGVLGTSSQTTKTFSVPFNIKNAIRLVCSVTDNGTLQTSPGLARSAVNSQNIDVYKTLAAGGFTSSGSAGFFVAGTLELA